MSPHGWTPKALLLAPIIEALGIVRIMKYIATFILLIGIYGCTTLPEYVPSVLVSLKTDATYEIKEKMESREVIYLELGVIPGAIYGAPLKEPRWYIDLNEDSAPHLDVANLENTLALYSAPADEETLKSNLRIQPKTTKLVRVSTFGVDTSSEQYLEGGLQDGYSNFMLLVYFDQPCTVIGDMDFGEEGIFSHNISIPEAGLYRLLITGFGESKTVTANKLLDTIFVYLR